MMLIVVPPERVDLLLGVVDRCEPVHVQAFFAEPSVERFDRRVVSRLILVTTSGYGKAAFEFAEGKPLELLSGSHLLYLLAEHAGIEAKIKVPDNWKDPQPDSPA